MEVRIIYANDRTVSKLNHVPGSCKIKQLKYIVAKINKMISADPIRLIYKGRILQNEDTLHKIVGELPVPQSVSIHAACVTRPEQRPVTQIPNPVKRTQNVDIPAEKGDLGMLLVALSVVIGIVMGISVASLLIDPSTYGVKNDNLQLEVTSKAAIFGIIFIFGLLMSLIVILKTICTVFQGNTWVASLREFFMSMLPFWDGKKFLNDHGLETFDQVDDPAFGEH